MHNKIRQIAALLAATWLLAACGADAGAALSIPSPSAAPAPSPSPQPAGPSPVPSPSPAPSPSPSPTPPPSATPSPAPSPSPTPDPFAEYEQFTIEGLRARAYGGGTIEVGGVRSQTPEFTRHLFSYESDGLRITGQLTRPRGEGPFPVIVLAHGYSPLASYTPGYDTQHASDYLAARGYLCLAPDFRSHAGSDKAPNMFRAGHVIDTLNLLPLIAQLPDARPGPVGIWGHSNGGEIATKVMLVSDQIAAALIYAPASPELADNYRAFHRRQTLFNPRNIADFPVTPEEAPDLYARMSPVNYLHYAQAPVQIHYGTADSSVPIEWVEKLHRGLLAAGKQSELFIYPGGTHSLQGADKQLYLERALAFFNAHLRP
ncbi:MAG: prolyl oligopeptidase family serine peptidase [Chloroflexota bacterium]